MEETDWHQRENPAKLTRSLIKFNIVLSKQTQSIFFSDCIYKKTNYYTINQKQKEINKTIKKDYTSLRKIHQNTGFIWSYIPYLDWIQEYAGCQPHLHIFSLNTGICAADKTRILVYFTQRFTQHPPESNTLGLKCCT